MKKHYGWEMWCPNCGTRYVVAPNVSYRLDKNDRVEEFETYPEVECDDCRVVEWGVNWEGISVSHDVGGVRLVDKVDKRTAEMDKNEVLSILREQGVGTY